MRFIFVLILSFSISLADDEYNKHHKHIIKDLSSLGLTDIQYTKAKEILKEYRIRLHEYREQKEILEKQKQLIFTKDILDLKNLEDVDTRLNISKMKLEIDLLSKFHSLLTIEQRKNFIEYIEEWEIE